MKKISGGKLRNYFTAILCAVAFFLIYVYQSVHLIKLGYSIQTKNEQLFGLSVENDNLNLELSKLTSLEHIDHIARTKLGLKFPGKDEVILIEASSALLKSKS